MQNKDQPTREDQPMPFNTLVMAFIRHIPPGRVLSYGRVAQYLGVPRGARAVGWALHGLPGSDDSNPVPWHRVVNAHGRVSIKGNPEAAGRQRALLEQEGVTFNENDRLSMPAHLWQPELDEVEAIIQAARAAYFADLD